MPIEPILDSLQVPQPLKAQAWEDWNRASDENDFKQRFDKIDLPTEVKARLWEEKFGQKAASAPTPAEQIKVAPTAKPVFPPNLPKPKLPGDLQRKPEDDMLPHEKFASMANKAADVANTHAIEKAGGTTLTKVYEGAQEGLRNLTEKALGEKYSATRERIPMLKAVEFAGDVAKVVPQTIDSMFTPLGAAAGVAGAAPKIAAVAKRVPWLASPEAQAATSAAFSTQQAQELPPAFREAATDLNPETAARAVTATAMTALPFIARGRKPNVPAAAERVLVDKYSDVRRMEDAATKGEGLPVDKSPYVGARMHAGREGITADRLQTLGEDILPSRMEPGMGFSPYGANPAVTPSSKLPNMRKYGLLEHYEEQFKDTPNYITPEGFKNINEVRDARLKMEQSMGPEVTKEIRDRLEKLYRFNDEIMQEANAAGIISDEHYANIKKSGRNSKYLPLQRLAFVSDLDDQGNVPAGSNVMSVASQNLVKNRSKEGSALAVRDPFESIVENVVKATNIISRNKVARKLGALSSDKRFAGLVEPMSPNENLPPDRGFISAMVDGTKQQYSVPKEVANAMKHLREEDVDFITKWAAKSAGALRAGATTLYAPFIPSNAIRDYQTATIASKVGFNPLDWADGFAEAINKGDDYRKYLRSGGSFAGFFEGKRNLPKTLEKLTQDPISKSVKETLNPVEMMRKIGEAIELAPRLGVFKRTLYGPIEASAGKGTPYGISVGRVSRGPKQTTPYEAGWNARNATVDFNKSGTLGRLGNMWIPFLNARLQGNINFYGSIKERPQASAFRLAAIAGLPAVATHLYLHKYYPKIAKDLAEYETDSNFIIPYGEEKDEQGRYTQVIKIPKGEIQPMTQGIEAFLTYLNKEDPKAYDRLAVKMLSGASPVPFAKEGKFDPATAGSAVIPPVAKGLLENWANKNFYTGQDIIPRDIKTIKASPENQYSIENTPELYVRMAKQMANMGMGVSPMQIQNLIKAQFGGLGRMAAEPNKGGNAFSTRFGTARGGRKQQENFKKLDEVSEAVGNEEMDTYHQAERLMQQLNSIKDPQKRKDTFVAALPADEKQAEALTKQMERLIEKKSRRGEETFEYVLAASKIKVRARMAIDALKELPPEERKPLYERWSDKKIITPAVEAEMERLITQQ